MSLGRLTRMLTNSLHLYLYRSCHAIYIARTMHITRLYMLTHNKSKQYIQNKNIMSNMCITHAPITCLIWHGSTFKVFVLPIMQFMHIHVLRLVVYPLPLSIRRTFPVFSCVSFTSFYQASFSSICMKWTLLIIFVLL